MVWLQIFATVVVCGAIIADVAKNNHQNNKYKTDCNSCAFLVRKDRWRLGEYKYHCREHGGFDKPPIFCADYRKRSTDEWETLDKGATSTANVRPAVLCRDCKHCESGWCHRAHNPAQYGDLIDRDALCKELERNGFFDIADRIFEKDYEEDGMDSFIRILKD